MNFSWNAPEYVYREKSADWFWAFGIIAVSAAIAAFIVSNILFGVLILLGAFVLALFAARKPEMVQFEINEKGIVINKTIYPYRNLESFTTAEGVLLVKTNKRLMQLLVIPLLVNHKDVRDFLLQHTKEDEELEIPLSQSLMELLGF